MQCDDSLSPHALESKYNKLPDFNTLHITAQHNMSMWQHCKIPCTITTNNFRFLWEEHDVQKT
jgi:hypothetical protein